MQFLVPPWQHQLETIRECVDRNYYGLFFDPGTGKTATVINILRTKYTKHQRLMRTLILTPRIVVPNWKREFSVHSRVPSEKVTCLTGSQKNRVKLVKKVGGSGHVFITNYEAMLMKDLHGLLKDWGIECLVLDESHKIKDYKAKRTKAVIDLSKTARYAYLLSGTPVLNNLMDLFTQYLCMDGGATFGTNFFSFRAKYFFDKNAAMPRNKYFPNWQIDRKKVAAIQGKLNATSKRILKKDCMDLPPLIRKRIEVEMSPEQKKHYKEMETAFITYLNDRACVAELAITKALRLQQIASGFLKLVDEGEDSDNVVWFPESPRIEALRELLSEHSPNHKLIVWAVFKQNYAMIRKVCEELGLKYVEVHGEIPDKDKDANVEKFNNDDDVRVFIGHPLSGGIGINLVASDISIFYSRNFSLEQDLQAEARNYRGGSERHPCVTRYDLTAVGTLDEKILEVVEQKSKLGDTAFSLISQASLGIAEDNDPIYQNLNIDLDFLRSAIDEQ